MGLAKRREQDRPRRSWSSLWLANHPVVGVSWYEAVAFCRWMTEQFQEKGQLDRDHRISLPTEPQWEKAARGETGRIYPWGDEPDPERANYEDTGIGTTSAVGCFPDGASPYGVLDMSGNVWEWTRTEMGEDYDANDGRENLDAGRGVPPRVAWWRFLDSTSGFVRCASRLWDNPYDTGTTLGFRVVVA